MGAAVWVRIWKKFEDYYLHIFEHETLDLVDVYTLCAKSIKFLRCQPKMSRWNFVLHSIEKQF